jgi:hypothetical protein
MLLIMLLFFFLVHISISFFNVSLGRMNQHSVTKHLIISTWCWLISAKLCATTNIESGIIYYYIVKYFWVSNISTFCKYLFWDGIVMLFHLFYLVLLAGFLFLTWAILSKLIDFEVLHIAKILNCYAMVFFYVSLCCFSEWDDNYSLPVVYIISILIFFYLLRHYWFLGSAARMNLWVLFFMKLWVFDCILQAIFVGYLVLVWIL